MESDLAKKVSGTYIADSVSALPSTLAYLTAQLRQGPLAEAINKFAEQQPEYVDPKLLIVEAVESDKVICRIPFKGDDHESPHTFDSSMQLEINILSGACTRSQ